jgi:hypothetical protein
MRQHSGAAHLARSSSGASRFVKSMVMVAALVSTVAIGGQTAFAGNGGTFPRAFHPETAAGFTNTFTGPTAVLSPKCPNGIAGTPGSDPASKVLNTALNTSSSFVAGGTVHYTYIDDPHGSPFGFTIQDCEVVYPPNFFTASDFNQTTGVLTNKAFTKSVLDAHGTMIDGASLSGISNAKGKIYFNWTVQSTAVGSWVCNFARDIRANHGGGGNRKATPTCFQVGRPPVFAGYADSFRPVGTGPTTPSVWKGGTKVTFVGCADPAAPTACGGDNGFDAGAIRIVNPSSTSTMTVQMSTAKVTIGTCVYTPWTGSGLVVTPPANEVVPGGGSLILTETGVTGTFAGCGDSAATPHDNFDTSEADEVGVPTKCAPNAAKPSIQLTITVGSGAQTTYTYTDSARILNTGGIDTGSCGSKPNETHDWSLLP